MTLASLRSVWPPLAVFAFALLLAMQIPHKAVFFKASADREKLPSFASIVTMEKQAYAALIQRTRLPWQEKSIYSTATIKTGAIEMEDESMPLPPLELDASFFRHETARVLPPHAQPDLMPTTQAAPEAVPSATRQLANDSQARETRKRMLAVPPSLRADEPYLPPALATPFQNELQP